MVEGEAPIVIPDIDEKLEEKVEEDPLAITSEDEESEEDPTLDEEELNPFGDKWEV